MQQHSFEECQSVSWDETVPPDSDPNHLFNSLYFKLSEIVDAHIPIKQLSRIELKVNSLKPWIIPAIKTSIQVKNKLF